MKLPGFNIYSEMTQCPECDWGFNRDDDDWDMTEHGERIEYVTCSGPEPHRWRVLDVYRDRSVWFYRVSGPVP